MIQERSLTGPPHENENPGALAGASGAEYREWSNWFENNLKRHAAARILIDAVLNCAPDDRLLFLETIFEGLRPGAPMPALYSIMDEAYFWADMASRSERKAYALACFQRMPERDQKSFIDYITRPRND